MRFVFQLTMQWRRSLGRTEKPSDCMYVANRASPTLPPHSLPPSSLPSPPQMWDLAGQDHFRQMSRTYFRGASGCVVMFDVTNRQTFENVAVWKADLDSKVVLPSGRPIPCILAANKVISRERGREREFLAVNIKFNMWRKIYESKLYTVWWAL